LRTFLAITVACAAFIAALACAVPYDELRSVAESEGVSLSFLLFVFGWIVSPCLPLIAGGVFVMPAAGLHSHILDCIRKTPAPRRGGWFQSALIGGGASLITVAASAILRMSSPESFADETCWRDFTAKDTIEWMAVLVAMMILGWAGILSPLARMGLWLLGATRRTLVLTCSVILTEVILLALTKCLAFLAEIEFDTVMLAEGVAWSILTITCAWLYVTRSLEHAMLALLPAPVIILMLSPLWAYLGI
jgi:hypothetical protein